MTDVEMERFHYVNPVYDQLTLFMYIPKWSHPRGCRAGPDHVPEAVTLQLREGIDNHL